MSQDKVDYKFKKKDQPDEIIIKIINKSKKYEKKHITSTPFEENYHYHKLRKNNTLTTSYLFNKLIACKITNKKVINPIIKNNLFIKPKQNERQLSSSKNIIKKVNYTKMKNTKKLNIAKTPINNKITKNDRYSTTLTTKKVKVSLSKTNILFENHEKKSTILLKNKNQKKLISPPEKNHNKVNSFCNKKQYTKLNNIYNKLSKVNNNYFIHPNNKTLSKDSKNNINSKQQKTYYENLSLSNKKNKTCISGKKGFKKAKKDRKKIEIYNKKNIKEKIISEIFKYTPKYMLKKVEEKQKKLITSQSEENYKGKTLNNNDATYYFGDSEVINSYIPNLSIPTLFNKKNYIVDNLNNLNDSAKEKYEINNIDFDYCYKNNDIFMNSNRTSINLKSPFKGKIETQNKTLDKYQNTENKTNKNRQYETYSNYSKKKFRSLSKEQLMIW